jgi:hypothetical protein
MGCVRFIVARSRPMARALRQTAPPLASRSHGSRPSTPFWRRGGAFIEKLNPRAGCLNMCADEDSSTAYAVRGSLRLPLAKPRADHCIPASPQSSNLRAPRTIACRYIRHVKGGRGVPADGRHPNSGLRGNHHRFGSRHLQLGRDSHMPTSAKTPARGECNGIV